MGKTGNEAPGGLDRKTEGHQGEEGTVGLLPTHPDQVCARVWRGPTCPTSSRFPSLKSHPRDAQKPCVFTAGLGPYCPLFLETVLPTWSIAQAGNFTQQPHLAPNNSTM